MLVFFSFSSSPYSIIIGTFCVIKAGAKKSETIDATEALRITTGDDASTVANISILKSPMTRRSQASDRHSINNSSHKNQPPAAKVIWDHS